MTAEAPCPADHGPSCPACGSDMDRATCRNCGGEGCHDVYDDDPLWYEPGDTEPCDICEGEGGWWVCVSCHPGAAGDLE